MPRLTKMMTRIQARRRHRHRCALICPTFSTECSSCMSINAYLAKEKSQECFNSVPPSIKYIFGFHGFFFSQLQQYFCPDLTQTCLPDNICRSFRCILKNKLNLRWASSHIHRLTQHTPYPAVPRQHVKKRCISISVHILDQGVPLSTNQIAKIPNSTNLQTVHPCKCFVGFYYHGNRFSYGKLIYPNPNK